MLFSIEAGFELTAAVELAMSPIIVHASAVGNIVGVGIVNEILYLFTVFFVVFGFVFVLDLGFDIEESCAVVLAPLATVTLCN